MLKILDIKTSCITLCRAFLFTKSKF